MISSKLTRKSLEGFLKTGERLDGRGFDDFRPIEIVPNFIEKAEGSALVKLGNTKVLVGVKLDVGEPFPDTPEQGILITNAELTPMSNEAFEPGPPDERAIELARVVDRVIRESEVIELEKLCIEPGEKVWIVFVDIYTLDADGNLFDASTLGAMKALLTAKMPRFEDGQVIREELKEKLPVSGKAVSVTFAKIGKHLLVDPSYFEEQFMDARLTIGFREGNIVAMQKGGLDGFTQSELDEILTRAEKHAGNLVKLL